MTTNRFHIQFNPLFEESMIRFKKQYKIRFFKKLNGDQPGWSIPVEYKDQINEILKEFVKKNQETHVNVKETQVNEVLKDVYLKCVKDQETQVNELYKDEGTQTCTDQETQTIVNYKDQETQCDWDDVVSNVIETSDNDVHRIYKNDIADEVKDFFKTFLQKDLKI